MTIGQGHIVRNGRPMSALTLAYAQTDPATPQAARVVGRGHIVPRERIEAAQQAAQLISQAQARATEILREAEHQADAVRKRAQREGSEQGAAKLAAARLALSRSKAQADEEALERSLAIGRLLAERLIGESLQLDPDLVASIAREAMHHLWRSETVTIHANPEDTAALERHVTSFGMPPERVTILADATCTRGCLRFSSDFGQLDGELGPQLDHLIDAIRQELGAG